MDWLSSVTGLAGVVVGGVIGLRGARVSLDRQLADAQRAREEAERFGVVTSLSQVLIMLLEKAEEVPEGDPASGQQDAAWDDWERQWKQCLRATRVAALDVREPSLRIHLVDGANYMQSLYVMEYAFQGDARKWVLRNAAIHYIECVSAWRRGDALPLASATVDRLKESYELRGQEYRDKVRAERERGGEFMSG
ncbi:hypothetical protein OG864_05320 [Streptomyces sp. NBC_00124]|uniref:hypothetical protein n=1 Tax=Streptomyces sp. NBC_00124 TaxID=2975662 RepID=UPI00224CE2C5|nr:hypothetical protein [Streptomyces sp. NBC_00124]MCX5358121.1 hypothetical protein [Streptomyces sp. NBC_00124]